MLKYLVIQLCDMAPSFCHYYNPSSLPNLIPLEDLKAGILFGMKENLNIQFVYPDRMLPKEYKDTIDSIDHVDIVSFWNKDEELLNSADIIIIDSWEDVTTNLKRDKSYILRTSKDNLFNNYKKLIEVLPKVERINIALTDIPEFKDEDFKKYKIILSEISESLSKEYIDGKSPQTNILTDRMMLNEMNNCNAGDEAITLAPDGNLYICPAFYLKGYRSIGNIDNGIQLKNPQLFKLTHAPICRKCDAFQCKRCVYLNKRITREINTPSKEQCVVSHLERNESRRLLAKIREHGVSMPDIEIKEIDYLDPFEIANQWK